jgi:hypothetical protein
MERISHLSDLGEAQLLRQLNDAQLEIDRQCTATGKLELGMKELSHLHAQLNSITLQCTIIVGFSLSGIGSDTLAQLASDVDQFCMCECSLPMTPAQQHPFHEIAHVCAYIRVVWVPAQTNLHVRWRSLTCSSAPPSSLSLRV